MGCYREMFAKERLEVFQAAKEAAIPALVVEKPLAIQWEDYLAIQPFVRTSKVKIAVNHQLHFHPRRAALQRLVLQGGIGDIRFVDARTSTGTSSITKLWLFGISGG